MWVYYEEIDGDVNPKWVILEANTEKDCQFYSVEGPFKRFYPEDINDNFKAVTVTMGELLRDPFEDNSFGVAVHTLREMYDLSEISYFILLCDDVQEVLQLDLSRELYKAVG